VAFHAQYGADDSRSKRIALATLLRARGRVLDAVTDSLVRLRLRGEAEDLELLARWTSLLAEESDWHAAKLNQVQPDPKRPSRDPDFDKIRVARENIEREIALRIAEVRIPSAPRVDVATVQAALPEETVLVEFIKFQTVNLERPGDFFKEDKEPRYAAFVLGSSGSPTWVDLGEANVIDAKIHELRDAWMKEDAAQWRRVACDLDKLLIEPIRPAFCGARHVLVVPSSDLCAVPFAALVDQDGKYEIQQYTFTSLTTGRDLVRPKAIRTDYTPLLILAGPDYEQIDVPDGSDLRQRRGRGPASFPPLHQAKEEGRKLHELIPGSILRTGPSASKLAIEGVKAPSILHIATHGFFQPDVRDEWTRKIDDFSGAALPSPLLRSGIALAGANRYRNGLLTALEISGLDLRGTEVVTLSACETGLGDVSSWEGVYGFRRSFFLAGAESLLVSLFPVPDDATKHLMEAYYERLLSGKGRSQALREAQLSMLDVGEAGQPFDWAAFIMIGDWRPITLEHR
jgi:CHAT domain-containing protein